MGVVGPTMELCVCVQQPTEMWERDIWQAAAKGRIITK